MARLRDSLGAGDPPRTSVLYNNDANAAALYAHYSQVPSARSEYVDWLLIRSERHLVRVLPDIEHSNHARPHRSHDLRPPCASTVVLHRLRRLSASVTGTGSAG
jgi:hypothetical protein